MEKQPARASDTTRRSFFERSLLYITGLVGLFATMAISIPYVGYFLGPLKKKAGPWVNLGPVDKFPVSETRYATFDNPLQQSWDGMTAHTGVYVRNQGKDQRGKDAFLIFAVNCAHLGCPVRWFPQSGLFMCPCHGGAYYRDGSRASGPPERGLFEYPHKVENGLITIQAGELPTPGLSAALVGKKPPCAG